MKKKLKIAMMVASELPIPIPKKFPRAFASIPISTAIAEGMTKKGHKVSFFAPKDSESKKFKIVRGDFKSLYRNKDINLYELSSSARLKVINFFDQYLLSLIYEKFKKEKFDIIHLHGPVDRVTFPIVRMFPKIPVVYTIHDPLSAEWRIKLHRSFKTKHQYLVSISNAQRKSAPDLNWIGTVYNGIDLKDFRFNNKPKDYLLFAGRILKRKGVYEAIQVAKKTNNKLLIAGDYYTEKGYWEKKIKPNLSDKIKYLGFISPKQLARCYSQAKATLMPILWEEPFGLTFIESMACGTPPIAFARGSAKEIIKNGKNGFVVKTLGEMVKAVKKIGQIDRKECRKWVEENFSLEKMVDGYEEVYYKILKKR